MKAIYVVLILVSLNSCIDYRKHLLDDKLLIFVPDHLTSLNSKQILDSSHLYLSESPKGHTILPDYVFINSIDTVGITIYYPADLIPDSVSYIDSWFKWYKEFEQNSNKAMVFDQCFVDSKNDASYAQLRYWLPYKGERIEYFTFSTILNNRFLEIHYYSFRKDGKEEKNQVSRSIDIIR